MHDEYADSVSAQCTVKPHNYRSAVWPDKSDLKGLIVRWSLFWGNFSTLI